MPDYSKGKIYTITCKTDPTLVFVGFTIQDLGICFSNHKRLSKKKTDVPLYKSVNNMWNYWYIQLYEEYPCFVQEQLVQRRNKVCRDMNFKNIC